MGAGAVCVTGAKMLSVAIIAIAATVTEVWLFAASLPNVIRFFLHGSPVVNGNGIPVKQPTQTREVGPFGAVLRRLKLIHREEPVVNGNAILGAKTCMVPSKNIVEQLQECLPSAAIHPLQTSVCAQLVQSPSCLSAVEVFLVLVNSSPPVLIFIEKNEVTDAGDFQTFRNALTRELTSVLQSRMLDPICIIPVFVRRGQELKAEVVERSVSEAKSLVPYGRWLMTRSKFRALQEATEHTLKLLKRQ